MKKIIAISFAFLLTLTLNAQNNAMVEGLIADGTALHDQGDYEGALKKYDKALEHEKDNLTAMSEKALTLVFMGRYNESIKLCKYLIKEMPETMPGAPLNYTTYGNALDLSGKSKKALKIYDKGIKKFPDYYMLYFNRGVTLVNLQKNEEAIESFQQAVKVNPNHASSHDAIGRLMLAYNKKVPAILAFSRFLMLERQGLRTKENFSRLEEILKLGVKKNKDGGSLITLNVNSLSDEKTPNDFSSIDLLLSMSYVGEGEQENKEKTKHELWVKKFGVMFTMLTPAEDRFGFFWEYYAPYFYELHQNGYSGVFMHVVLAANEDQVSIDWLEANSDKVDEFNLWSSNYNWNID